MEMRKLGREGPEISVVGFGAWEAGGDMWGPNQSEDQIVTAILAGLDSGMSWVDTAEVYGKGTSEEIVGRALAGRRDRALIFTKVAPTGSGSGFRPDQVKRAIRASLDRLQTDHVDLYQLHWPSGGVPVEDTWGAMADIQDEGLTRHIGVSNVDWGYVERCERIRHVDSVQNQLSLINQDDRSGLLAQLADAGIGYLAYSPLGLGILTGAITPETEFHPKDFRGAEGSSRPRQFRPENMDRILGQVERLRPIADRLGTIVAGVALRWVIEQRGVTAAIAGSRNPDHVLANAAVGNFKLDDKTREEIEEIFAS